MQTVHCKVHDDLTLTLSSDEYTDDERQELTDEFEREHPEGPHEHGEEQ